MYRFLETDRHGDLTNGVTSVSVKALKHLPKVGKLRTIKGYVYASKRKDDHCPLTRIGVRVEGENGYMRFGGFLWGYGGEGPHGLEQLFNALEISIDPFTLCNGSPDYSKSSIGEWWRIEFDDDGNYTLTVKRHVPKFRRSQLQQTVYRRRAA
jgi:hypothetical protein